MNKILILLGVAAVAACSIASPAGRAARWVGPFHGSWLTSYGDMTLTQSGAVVAGTYSRLGVTGTIMGKVEGKSLTFKWKNVKNTGGAPVKGDGDGKVKLSESGNGFAGKWNNSPNANGLSGDWGGIRRPVFLDPPTGGIFAGLWGMTQGNIGVQGSKHHDLRLFQKGNLVTGSYVSGNGEGAIEGIVVGRTLRLTWINADKHSGGTAIFTLSAAGDSFKGTINKPVGHVPKPGDSFWNGKKK